MFDFAEKPIVWIPVRWRGLKPNGDDLAEPVEHEIQCLVEIVDRDKLREVFPGGGALVDPDETPEASRQREKDILLALCHDWRGVRDGGAPVPFNPANIDRMLKLPMFGTGFERSYIDAWTGQVEIREKNSGSSSAGGRAEEGRARQPKTGTKRGR